MSCEHDGVLERDRRHHLVSALLLDLELALAHSTNVNSQRGRYITPAKQCVSPTACPPNTFPDASSSSARSRSSSQPTLTMLAYSQVVQKVLRGQRGNLHGWGHCERDLVVSPSLHSGSPRLEGSFGCAQPFRLVSLRREVCLLSLIHI